ncbi:MAG: virulence RhuM family protein [Bacteroidales bacterium]|nr:virulence RhuM family protein [Bacteroidales bacterium]
MLNDRCSTIGKPFDKGYFDELLERIRKIHDSERRTYQKLPMCLRMQLRLRLRNRKIFKRRGNMK